MKSNKVSMFILLVGGITLMPWLVFLVSATAQGTKIKYPVLEEERSFNNEPSKKVKYELKWGGNQLKEVDVLFDKELDNWYKWTSELYTKDNGAITWDIAIEGMVTGQTPFNTSLTMMFYDRDGLLLDTRGLSPGTIVIGERQVFRCLPPAAECNRVDTIKIRQLKRN